MTGGLRLQQFRKIVLERQGQMAPSLVFLTVVMMWYRKKNSNEQNADFVVPHTKSLLHLSNLRIYFRKIHITGSDSPVLPPHPKDINLPTLLGNSLTTTDRII
jgi:hypothetical protein